MGSGSHYTTITLGLQHFVVVHMKNSCFLTDP